MLESTDNSFKSFFWFVWSIQYIFWDFRSREFISDPLEEQFETHESYLETACNI